MSNFDETLTDRDRARLDAATDAVAARAKAAGVTLDKETLSVLPSIRLATLTENSLNLDTAMAEARVEFAEAFRSADVRMALDAKDKDALDAINSLPPSERMNVGRRLDALRPAEAKKPLSPEDAAAAILMIRKIKSPAAKIAAARAAGL